MPQELHYFFQSILIQYFTSSSLPIWRCGAVAAPGTTWLGAGLPQGLCQGAGPACFVMSLWRDLLGDQELHLGARSAASFFSDVGFPMWFRDLALVKSEILFLCFQQVAPLSSLLCCSKGEMCSWKGKCVGESRRGWAVHFPGGRVSPGFASLLPGRCITQALPNVVG